MTSTPNGQLTPAELADVAAEALRALNHATNWRGGYEYPADVDAVIAVLHTLAARLGQALEQAGRWLITAADSGRVGHDQGADVALCVELLSIALDTARADAARLAHSLDTARAESSHLTGTTGSTGTTP